MKVCRGCGKLKNINQFYKHPAMKDGHLNYCIECKREYARWQIGTPKKLASSRRWNQKNMSKIAAQSKIWAKNNPEKRKAHWILWYAIKKGEITKGTICQKCSKSNTQINAHHYDYSKPLEVIWVCRQCHCKV